MVGPSPASSDTPGAFVRLDSSSRRFGLVGSDAPSAYQAHPAVGTRRASGLQPRRRAQLALDRALPQRLARAEVERLEAARPDERPADRPVERSGDEEKQARADHGNALGAG